MGHEAVVAFKVGEDGARFSAGEDDGQLGRTADALDAIDKREFAIEHLLIKKENRAEGLVLSGGGDTALDREMAQEGGDLGFAHLGRMAFLVEEDEAPDPIEISLLGADAVALDAQVPAHAIEQLLPGRRGARRGGNGSDHAKDE